MVYLITWLVSQSPVQGSENSGGNMVDKLLHNIQSICI